MVFTVMRILMRSVSLEFSFWFGLLAYLSVLYIGKLIYIKILNNCFFLRSKILNFIKRRNIVNSYYGSGSMFWL